MYLAIDIGGTKTLLAVFESDGKLLKTERFETPQQYPAFLQALVKAYGNLPESPQPKLCVVGAPGRVDRKRGIVTAFGNLPWENTPLKEDIQEIVDTEVIIENDANLAGLSEARLISYAHKKILYLTISTGIGGILIKDGKIVPEYADMEFGHMMFEHGGRLKSWEDFASGRAINQKYGKKASEIDDPQTWYAISRDLALGLTNIVVTLTPDVVIIGGGVGAHFDKFADRLHEEMMIYSTKLVSVPPIHQAIRAEEAVIYGCYELARQHKKD